MHPEKGAINIILLAITLPLLITLSIAAYDIVRLPIVKQQLNRAVANSFHFLTYDYAGTQQVGTGMNWCLVTGTIPPDVTCPTCVCGDSCGCTGAKETSHAIEMSTAAINSIVGELSSNLVGTLNHSSDKIGAQVALYNVIVDQSEVSGPVIGFESVSSLDGTGLGATFSPGFRADAIVTHYIADGETNLAPVISTRGGSDAHKTIHIPVAVITVGVSVPHIISLPAALRFGSSMSDADNSVLVVEVVHPLPRSYRLSGPIAPGVKPIDGLPTDG